MDLRHPRETLTNLHFDIQANSQRVIVLQILAMAASAQVDMNQGAATESSGCRSEHIFKIPGLVRMGGREMAPDSYSREVIENDDAGAGAQAARGDVFWVAGGFEGVPGALFYFSAQTFLLGPVL